MNREELIDSKAKAIYETTHKLLKILDDSDLDAHDEIDALGMLVAFKVRIYGHQKDKNLDEEVMEYFLASCSHLLPNLKFQIINKEP